MKVTFVRSLTVYFSILIIFANGKVPNKIIGGRPVDIVEYNHQVSVQIKNTHICGGTIIGMRYILTTASCISSEISDDFHATYGGIQILSGTDNLLEDSQEDSRMINDVSYIIHYEEYNIPILKLEKPLLFDAFRAAVGLSSQHRSIGCGVHITGWGEDASGKMINYLQYLDAISSSSRKCKLAYKAQGIRETQFCIAPQSPLAHLTHGNGGSAVMMKRKIIGVLSAISTHPVYPGIYTRIFRYYDWMMKNSETPA